MRIQVFALLVGMGLLSAASAADFTPEEQAVRNMEEAYWRYVKAGEVDAYTRLSHENFVGQIPLLHHNCVHQLLRLHAATPPHGGFVRCRA
jgi:hypothetical protein